MKYTVFLDGRGYVTNITQTGHDYVELNLDEYDFSNGRKRAYRLGKNKLIFDEKEFERILAEEKRKEDDEEIADLEQKLNDTDYIIARWGEEIVGLTNPLTWVADVIKINVKYATQYKEALKNRKEWRARIEELRGE